MKQLQKIGLGGGCHWCTEAVFQSLKGVFKVEQGFIASTGERDSYSEAVIVHFCDAIIALKDIITIHLHTHSSTSQHSMRNTYRSAVYVFSDAEVGPISTLLECLQYDFEKKLITQVLSFGTFKASDSQYHDYFFTDPNRPFCRTYIAPKLRLLLDKFSVQINSDVVAAPAIKHLI